MSKNLWKNLASQWENSLLRWRPKLPLIKKKEFFEVTLQSIGDGVIIVDEKGRIIFFNRMAETLTGWGHLEVLGKPLNHVFKIMDKVNGEPILDPYLSVIHSQKIVGLKNNTVLISKTGDERYISASSAPIMEKNNGITGVVVVFRDITRIKQAEEELQKTKEAAEKANRAKSDFLANMSHEIRTPLNGIIGMTDLTLLTDLTAEQSENLNIVKASAHNLLKVINDILDYSKIEAGKMTLEKIQFDIRDLMNQTIRFHTVSAGEKGLTLSAEIDPAIPPVLAGDPVRLQQVLNNLIGNAVKFTDHGAISVALKKNTIINHQINLQFAIADTGIGIAADKQEFLFKSFSQVDGSITRKYGGTGLGLAISKKMVELMGGSIWVRSNPGVGSTFYFTVFFNLSGSGGSPGLGGAALVGDDGYVASGSESGSGSHIFKVSDPLRILVVDDDPINQMVLLPMLEKKGHLAEAVSSGQEALLAVDQKSFDLILMDIQMPGLDGVETLRLLRQKEEKNRCARVPVIAVTAYALQGDREKYLNTGMTGYVPKPVQMEELYGEIDRLFPLKDGAQADPRNQSTPAEILKSLELEEPDSSRIDPRQFRSEGSTLLQKIKDAVDSENRVLLEQSAYSLKILASQAGNTAIKNLAFKMQMAARQNNSSGAIGSLYQRLKEEFERL